MVHILEHLAGRSDKIAIAPQPLPGPTGSIKLEKVAVAAEPTLDGVRIYPMRRILLGHLVVSVRRALLLARIPFRRCPARLAPRERVP